MKCYVTWWVRAHLCFYPYMCSFSWMSMWRPYDFLSTLCGHTIFFLHCVELLFTWWVLLVTSCHCCNLPGVTFMFFSLMYCGYNVNKLMKNSFVSLTDWCHTIAHCMSGFFWWSSRHSSLNTPCHIVFVASIFTVHFIS